MACGSHREDFVVFRLFGATHRASQDHENAAPNITILTNDKCIIFDIMMWCWHGAISCTRELEWKIESNQPIPPLVSHTLFDLYCTSKPASILYVFSMYSAHFLALWHSMWCRQAWLPRVAAVALLSVSCTSLVPLLSPHRVARVPVMQRKAFNLGNLFGEDEDKIELCHKGLEDFQFVCQFRAGSWGPY